MKGYEYQSDFAKKYVAQGRVEEADPSVLERWHERAVVASSMAEVFQMAH